MRAFHLEPGFCLGSHAENEVFVVTFLGYTAIESPQPITFVES